MDPIGMAVSAFKFGVETVQMMQKTGALGGSMDWVNYIPDIDLLYENFVKFKGIIADKAKYDELNGLPEDEKKNRIYGMILLEGMEAKNARLRERLGTPLE